MQIESDTGRYRLLTDGSLEIVSLYRNDSGVYICVAANELGRATQEIRLEVDGECISSRPKVRPQMMMLILEELLKKMVLTFITELLKVQI